MKKNLKERISASFPEGDRESAKQYLEWLRATLSDRSASMRRSATLVVALIAIFEFVVGSPHSTFVLVGFTVSKSSVVLKFIPALVAYFFFQLIVDTTEFGYLHRALTYTMRCWSPQAEQNDLDILIMPVTPLYWNPPGSKIVSIYRTDKVSGTAMTTFMVVILISTLIFEIHAYVALFPSRSILNYIIWGSSLLLTLFCLAMAVIYTTEYEAP